MNREVCEVLHGTSESSCNVAVNEMWKLWKASAQSKFGQSYSRASEEFGTNFSHQRSGLKWVRISELVEFSTSAKRLLLRLVIFDFYLI